MRSLLTSVSQAPPWENFPVSFRADAERYLLWASVSDPLDEGARARALRPRTLGLHREHLHSAASAAVAVGIGIEQLTSLTGLVDPENFRKVLRQLWQQGGRKLSAYTHGVAITLIAIAAEWAKTSPEKIAILKEMPKKLGVLPELDRQERKPAADLG